MMEHAHVQLARRGTISGELSLEGSSIIHIIVTIIIPSKA